MIQSTSHSVSQRQAQAHLDEQSPEEYIRRLVAHCQELACQYQTTPEIVLERTWWQSLYGAGVRLRDTLEEYRDRWHMLHLTSQEVEQAYLTLIRVAYFFEPGQVAEVIFKEQGWVWSDQ
jgi:hypothetical protein